MFRSFLSGVARLFLSLPFLVAALHILLHWHAAEKDLVVVLCEWQSTLHFSDIAEQCLCSLTIWSPFLLISVEVLLIVGGFFVLAGIREKLGAFFLAFVEIPFVVLFHPFWLFDGAERGLEMQIFLTHLAMLGGLFLLILHGGNTTYQK